MPANEQIFPTRDNVSLVLFKQDDVAIDFSLASRFVLSFGTDVIDTDVSPTAITTTANQGELRFDLGQEAITSTGTQWATIVVYDINHPNGQVLACEEDENLSFQIKEC